MDTNRGEVLLLKKGFRIVRCAIEVLNTLGHGLLEKHYENPLVKFVSIGVHWWLIISHGESN